MKGLSDIFIKRPVATTLLMVGIIIFGISGYRQLPVSDLPNVDFPTIQVSAGLPGRALRQWHHRSPHRWKNSFPPLQVSTP